ncbi:MAG: hypothetical protein II996_07395 [Oscillospiraceae bacterium]|nr:hypothetical protein [Oscillospiraceae bacterium]MBQ4545375.1 hypothetical protein [Oscillospiraceae bacterium]
MKKLLSITLILCLIFNFVGCSGSSENIIETVKNMKLADYSDKSIGNALKNYFNDYDLKWTASKPENNVYTVEASIIVEGENYIEFRPNNITNDVLHIKQIYFSFDYNKKYNVIDTYKIYGTLNNNGKLQLFETKNDDEASLFFNRIYGVQPSTFKSSKQIDALYALKEKVEKTKTNQEARNIAGNDNTFSLSISYLNENNITRKEILSIIDSMIKTEKEIENQNKNMYK